MRTAASGRGYRLRRWFLRQVANALVMAYGPFLAMLLAGLEIRAQGLPEATVMVYVLGILVVAVGILVTVAAMLADRFFGPVLRIQSDRDHVVVPTARIASSGTRATSGPSSSTSGCLCSSVRGGRCR